VPSALGLFFTSWLLSPALLWGAAITMVAIVVMLVLLRRHALTAKRLFAMAGLYGVFVLGVAILFR
jgi:cation:H+ antiporter